MRLPLAAALALLPAIAFADPAGIRVEHAWSRAMPAGGTGVVYLTVTDQAAPNALTGASSPVAGATELHETINDHGVMKMRPVARLPVAQGEPARLAPGGYHIMLIGLKHPLVAGTRFPVTLTFAQGGKVTAMVTVQKPGAAMPGMSHDSMGNMDMHGMSMRGSESK